MFWISDLLFGTDMHSDVEFVNLLGWRLSCLYGVANSVHPSVFRVLQPRSVLHTNYLKHKR